MNEAPSLRLDSKELAAAIAEYIRRCERFMDRAFLRNYDARVGMRAWLQEKFQNSADPVMLLHDDPLYTVARYLGIPPLEISPEIMDRAAKLALKKGW